MPEMSFTTPRAEARIARMLAVLAEQPMSRPQIQDALFMSKSTAYLYLNFLQAAPRRVYIVRYDPPETVGRHTPVYALGRKRDAVEPPRVPKSKRWREMKADSLAHAMHLAARRRRAIKPRQDELHAWIPRK